MLDGHESYHLDKFKAYYKEYNIITLCMPPHLLYLLQPLDVSCFGLLKKAYGNQIEEFIRMHIIYISKLEFLCAFKEAFFALITEGNI